jgi:3-oxoadipate enol-lactonase
MHYDTWGEDPTVVCAHGMGGNSLSWWQQVGPFTEHYQLVTFDHRWFGLSGGGEGSEDFVGDLESLLDFLGIDIVSLVGQSMGGFTCAGFAVRRPARVEALVLSGSLAGLNPPALGDEDAFQALLAAAADWETFVKREVGKGDFPSRRPDLSNLYRMMSDLNLRASAPVLEAAARTYYDIGAPAAAGIPVLLLNGEADDEVGHAMARLAKSLPRGRYITIPDAGHLAFRASRRIQPPCTGAPGREHQPQRIAAHRVKKLEGQRLAEEATMHSHDIHPVPAINAHPNRWLALSEITGGRPVG